MLSEVICNSKITVGQVRRCEPLLAGRCQPARIHHHHWWQRRVRLWPLVALGQLLLCLSRHLLMLLKQHKLTFAASHHLHLEVPHRVVPHVGRRLSLGHLTNPIDLPTSTYQAMRRSSQQDVIALYELPALVVGVDLRSIDCYKEMRLHYDWVA
jgi:hypothetical protein